MKIAIEAQRIFRKKKHGMDFVALEMIRELQKIDLENEYYILTANGEDDSVLQESKNFRIIKIKCHSYLLWEQVALPCYLLKLKPDILHCTSNTGPLLYFGCMVLTLHDVIFLEKRGVPNRSFYQQLGRYYRRFIVPLIIKKSNKIITVSNYELRIISEIAKVETDLISVVYNGFGTHFFKRENPFEIVKLYIPHNDFIFFLGNTDPKKNTVNVLRAYADYIDNTDSMSLPLLIADLSSEIVNSILKEENIFHIRELIFTPGYISNNHLPYIYSAAKIFLYPSLRESFGIPILESMACGTPVITSDRSAMPEIAGDGAILADPDDYKSISREIFKLIYDKNYYISKVEYGYKRAKLFSWRVTAQEVKAIYNSLR